VGAILTQNTNWQNVEKAIGNLKAKKVLSAKALYRLPVSKLASLIKPSGYFNIKAGRLRHFLSFLVVQNGGSLKRVFSGNLADVRKKLLEVKGIGPETADSMILYAAGLPTFVIDAYTKRIFSRLGLCEKDVTYHDLQTFFMKNLPSDAAYYNEYHALLVMLGKHFCKPKPFCGGCPMEKICEFAKK
jgi:endonuclease-3 related protein